MEDSRLFAKLTLMLLRASAPHPDSLPSGYGIVILERTGDANRGARPKPSNRGTPRHAY